MGIEEYYKHLLSKAEKENEDKSKNANTKEKSSENNSSNLKAASEIPAVQKFIELTQNPDFLKSLGNAAMSFNVNPSADMLKEINASANNMVVNNNVRQLPQFNCTVNIDGSADEKTVERMKTEMNSMLCEYTIALTNSINTESMKRKFS